MDISNTLNIIIDELKKIDEVCGIYLFGSYSNNSENPLSDIDIAVVLSEINQKVEANVGSMYSPNIDLVLFHKLPLYIKFEVFKTGKELFVKDEDFILNLKLSILREYLDTTHMYKNIKKESFK